MLEKIKEVPFIDESAAVRVKSIEGKTVLERNDRVIWASEETTLQSEGIDCYVEAEKFLTLLPEVKSLYQGECLVLTLKNDAKYELPFLSVSWETPEMATEYENTIMFKLDDLMLCTLKNLVKPELQCIYIDEAGAVSCDFVSACISDTVRASQSILLPPDVQALVNGRQCKVHIDDDKIYILSSDFKIITPKPTMSEDRWWEGLRQMVAAIPCLVNSEKLAESLKRLVMFGDYISFNDNKVWTGTNFEPFEFVSMPSSKYEIEKVAKVLTTANKITADEGNLIFMNESSKFLVSPMEDA